MNIEPLKEKLDEKIKKLNSSRVIKKTPVDKKLFSSITLIIAMMFR